MPLITDDLTRRGGGDVLGCRLPADADRRRARAKELVDRAVDRWALNGHAEKLAATVWMLIDEDRTCDAEELHLRLSSDVLTVTLGNQLVAVPLTRTTTR